MNQMRIVFCGTPQFAVPSLKFLLTQNEFEIASVYTQPDRPRGRGQEISFSPVKEAATAAGLVAKEGSVPPFSYSSISLVWMIVY